VNKNELIDLGEQLRGVGHRRRELAERVYSAASEGQHAGAGPLFDEFDHVTSQAIELMEKQRDILAREYGRSPGGQSTPT
jgi:hypothetical protein